MKKFFLLAFLIVVSPLTGMGSQTKNISSCQKKSRSLINWLPNELVEHLIFFILNNTDNIVSTINDFKNFGYFLNEKQRYIILQNNEFTENDINFFIKSGLNGFLIAQITVIQLSNDFKKELINNLVKKYEYNTKDFDTWLEKSQKNLISKTNDNAFETCCNKFLNTCSITTDQNKLEQRKKKLLFMLLFLVSIGKDPNVVYVDKTKLMTAAQSNNEYLVNVLLEIGADPNMEDRDGFSAYSFALIRGNIKICKILIDAGAQIKKMNSPALVKAIITGNAPKVIELLDLGADPNSYSEEKAITEAIRFKREDIIKILVRAGANVDVKFNDGDTILMKAATLGSPVIVDLLLKANANPNLENLNGWTALTFAIFHLVNSNYPDQNKIIKSLLAETTKTQSLKSFLILPTKSFSFFSKSLNFLSK